MLTENEITKKILNKLRESKYRKAQEVARDFQFEEKEDDNFLTRSKILMEEAVDGKKKPLTEETNDIHARKFPITKSTPQFGDVRTSQEEVLKKTIGTGVELGSDALVYYPDADDMTLSGKINGLNLSFQFRYNDSSGEGAYVWTDGLQLTDTNARTIGKLRDAYVNWKNSIVQDGDLMDKLKQTIQRQM